jgi:ABC-type multidrug transport system ATPase subunit
MIIINKGATQVEGTVEGLLSKDKVSVMFEVNKVEETKEIIINSEWQDKLKSTVKNEMTFELAKDETEALNKFLIEKGIAVSAVVPVRSLEDYFLKITEGNGK